MNRNEKDSQNVVETKRRCEQIKNKSHWNLLILSLVVVSAALLPLVFVVVVSISYRNFLFHFCLANQSTIGSLESKSPSKQNPPLLPLASNTNESIRMCMSVCVRERERQVWFKEEQQCTTFHFPIRFQYKFLFKSNKTALKLISLCSCCCCYCFSLLVHHLRPSCCP